MNNYKPYKKPEVQYWPASKLDSIEATMSGGGGWGIQLKWEDNWIDYGYEGDYSLVISIVAGVIATVLTKNMGTTAQVSATVTSAIASQIVTNQITAIYYVRRVQHLYMLDGYTSEQAVWSLIGSAVKTDFYSDESRSNYIDTAEFNNIPTEYAYAISSLRW